MDEEAFLNFSIDSISFFATSWFSRSIYRGFVFSRP